MGIDVGLLGHGLLGYEDTTRQTHEGITGNVARHLRKENASMISNRTLQRTFLFVAMLLPCAAQNAFAVLAPCVISDRPAFHWYLILIGLFCGAIIGFSICRIFKTAPIHTYLTSMIVSYLSFEIALNYAYLSYLEKLLIDATEKFPPVVLNTIECIFVLCTFGLPFFLPMITYGLLLRGKRMSIIKALLAALTTMAMVHVGFFVFVLIYFQFVHQ